MRWYRLRRFMIKLYCILQYKSMGTLVTCWDLQYTLAMSKDQILQIRLSDDEKQGFTEAANVAGIPLSSWVRERLRLAAIRDLESVGLKIPFVKPVHLEVPSD